jgi:hypothetical protein
MSKTGIAGAIGFAHQSGKDLAQTSSVLYLPATSVGINPNQNAQTLPAEVGGDYFLRGSYKASAMGTGDIAFVARPNGLGHLLLMLCGVDTVVNTSASVYQHTMTPFAVGAGDLPWYSVFKDVSTVLAEEYINTRIQSLKLDVPKSGIMTGSATLVSTGFSEITSASLGIKTFDNSPQFQSCLASVDFKNEATGTTISSEAVKVERVSMSFDNSLSNDEFAVGSFFLEDITLQQRTVTVDLDYVIRSREMYEAVYYGGAGDGSGTQSWSPQLYRGSLGLTMNSLVNIPGTTTPYSCQFLFPGLDFMSLPISLSGAEVVRGTLSTQITLGTSGADRFTAILTNGIASY